MPWRMRSLLQPRVVAGVALGLLSLYALVGFFLLPYIITAYVVPAAEEWLKHPIVLRDAAFNPFMLRLRLTGLEVREADHTPILGFEEFVVDLRATTLFMQKAGFDEIRLVMPFVAAKVNREGKLNLLALAPPPDDTHETPPPMKAADEPKKMMPVEIQLLEINKGILEYRDESKARPVSMDIVPVEILLRNFSTIQGSANAYAFTAEIGTGETVAWQGTFSLEPVESDGKISLSGIKVGTLYQAVQDRFRFDVQQGELGVFGFYHFDLRGEAPGVTISDGRISVRDLAIGGRARVEPVAAVPTFNIEGIQFDLEKQSVNIGRVHSADARLDAWIDLDGVLNYQRLFTPIDNRNAASDQQATPGDEQEASSKPWTVSIGEIALRNYRALFEDRTLARFGHVEVEGVDFTAKDLQIPFTQPLPVELSMTLNQTGLVKLHGQVAVEPMTAEIDLALKQVEIRPFQPYLDRFLNVDVRDGVIDLSGALRFAKQHPKGPLLRLKGDLAVNRLAIADRKEFNDVITWKSLACNRLALEVEPTSVQIAEVVWQEPDVQLIVEADGGLNLSQLLAAPPVDEGEAGRREGEEEKSPAKSTAPVTVAVEQVKLVKAAATFRDMSLEPRVRVSLTDFGGTIKGLSSKQLKKADVDLAGKIDGAAPLKIAGKINPLSEDAFTDLIVTLGGMDLTPGGPYSGKYVGYGLSRGRLSLDLKYKVSQKVLEAENLVQIDQLTFGEKTDSPDAVSLPVPLVVALLKDRNGLIEIDLPIRGDLNDPDFKYGKVVVSTLFNLLGKIVASPFALLGKLVPGGGNEEDLQFIEFLPGSTMLAANELKKLDVLEQALDERAGLRVDIRGAADATLDRAALRAHKLKEQLLAMQQQERGKTQQEPEDLTVEEEERLIAKLFTKRQAPEQNQLLTVVSNSEQDLPPVDEMKRQLVAAIPVTEEELETLARQRGEVVRDRLLKSGTLSNERVLLIEGAAAGSGHEKVRIQLALAAS